LVVIERMMAIFSDQLAILGRCSQILTPVDLVAISLNSPPLAWPGFMSNRSMVDGPPDIHKRMQDLRLTNGAAAWAKPENQPDRPPPRTPAAESFSRSRRLTMGADMGAPCPPHPPAPSPTRGEGEPEREGRFRSRMSSSFWLPLSPRGRGGWGVR